MTDSRGASAAARGGDAMTAVTYELRIVNDDGTSTELIGGYLGWLILPQWQRDNLHIFRRTVTTELVEMTEGKN